jgi:hypothetical protein
LKETLHSSLVAIAALALPRQPSSTVPLDGKGHLKSRFPMPAAASETVRR